MAFTKPYAYVDGNVLTAAGQLSNEEAVRVYVNQEIGAADVASNTLDTTDFAAFRYISVGDNIDFVSKTVQGNTDILSPVKYAYFSATTKAIRQTSATSIAFQYIPDAGQEIEVDRANANFLITCYLKVSALANTTLANHPGQKLWDNQVALFVNYVEGGAAYVAGTSSYFFEPTGTSGGAKNPKASGNAASERSLCIQYKGALTNKGKISFNMAVNPKVEIGYVSVQSFIVETFYA